MPTELSLLKPIRGRVEAQSERRAMKKTVIASLLALSLAGCLKGSDTQPSSLNSSTTPTPNATTTVVSFQLPESGLGSAEFSEQDKKTAEDLLAGYADGEFDGDAAFDKENLRGFLYIVQSSEDERQRLKALEAAGLLLPIPESDTDAMDENTLHFLSVVYPLAQDDNSRLAAASLEALSGLLAQPKPPAWLVDAFFMTASDSPDPVLRYRAISGIGYLFVENVQPRIVEIIKQAEKEESPVVAEYKISLVDTIDLDKESDRKEIRPMLEELSKSTDPIIRGAALQSLAQWSNYGPLPEQVQQGLKDESPYVRACVIEGLVFTGNSELSSLLEPLVDDQASAVLEPRPLVYKDGRELPVQFRPAFGDTVGANAERAIRELGPSE